jgi:hypothetical protein
MCYVKEIKTNKQTNQHTNSSIDNNHDDCYNAKTVTILNILFLSPYNGYHYKKNDYKKWHFI